MCKILLQVNLCWETDLPVEVFYTCIYQYSWETDLPVEVFYTCIYQYSWETDLPVEVFYTPFLRGYLS
jgi:hypothetical protein